MVAQRVWTGRSSRLPRLALCTGTPGVSNRADLIVSDGDPVQIVTDVERPFTGGIKVPDGPALGACGRRREAASRPDPCAQTPSEHAPGSLGGAVPPRQPETLKG